MTQKFYVYFTFEGILGRESFETAETRLDAYQDAFSQFHAYARSIGTARTLPTSAWNQVLFYEGPKTLYAVPAPPSPKTLREQVEVSYYWLQYLRH